MGSPRLTTTTNIMVKREVERWDPPNKEMPKYPIPLWGATSIKVKANEAVGPIFQVTRENDFAANELKSDPLTQKKPEMGDKLVPTHATPTKIPSTVSTELAPLKLHVMLEVCPLLNMAQLMVSLMARMDLSHKHPLEPRKKTDHTHPSMDLFSKVLKLEVANLHQCLLPRLIQNF